MIFYIHSGNKDRGTRHNNDEDNTHMFLRDDDENGSDDERGSYGNND